MASRSLGTLTLDLVAKIGGFTGALSKSEREVEKWKKQIKRDAEQIGRAFAVAGAAVGAAVVAMTVSTVKSAQEIQKLSQVANTSTTEFQKYAAGARAVGVEQEKLADIFKDTSDKVGDFIQTGGGPLADFFEKIAPQVGVTADQFRNLSGPDALGLYVSSLEKANVSQNEMTFFMEAIASDATLLLPLLRDNGKGFKEFGDQAERAGAILGGDVLQSANELQAVLFLTEQTATGFKNGVVSALLPTLSDLAGVFSDVTVETSIATTVGEGFGFVVRWMAAGAVGAVAAFQLLGKSVGSVAAAVSAANIDPKTFLLPGPAAGVAVIAQIGKNLGDVKDALTIGLDDVSDTAEDYAELIDRILNAGSSDNKSDETGNKIKDLAKLLSVAREEAAKTSNTLGTVFAGKAGDRVKELQLQAKLIGLDDIETELEKIKALGADPIQLNLARESLLELATADIENSLRTEEESIQKSYERRRQIILDNTKLNSDARFNLLERLEDEHQKALEGTHVNQLVKSLQTEEEAIIESYNKRREIILDSVILTEQEKQAALKRLGESLETEFENTELGRLQEQLLSEEAAIQKSYEKRKELILESTRLTGEEQTELLKALEEDRQKQLAAIEIQRLQNAELLFGSIADLARQFAGEQSTAFKAAFALEKAAAIARAIVAIQTGIAQAAALPFPTNLGAIASVASATAGIISTIKGTQIQGVAHAGLDKVPTTGTYLLEKGERVTTEKTSAKLDRKLDKMDGANQQPLNVRLNNIIDPSFVGDYMSGSEGDRVIDNYISRNQTKIKRIVG